MVSARILEARQLVVRQLVPWLHHAAANVDRAAERAAKLLRRRQRVVVEHARHRPEALGLRIVHDCQRRAAHGAHVPRAVFGRAYELERPLRRPAPAVGPHGHPRFGHRAAEAAAEVAVAVLRLSTQGLEHKISGSKRGDSS